MTNEEIIREIKSGNRVQENMYLLYTQNLTLLKLWSKKYTKVLGDEDVLQECYIAVHKAVQGFDVSKEYKFTSYLQKAVQTHLSRASNRSNKSKLGINDKRLLAQYIELNQQHQQRTGNDISLSQAADLLHCSQKNIERISQYLSIQHCSSIDKPMGDGSDDDLNVIEVLPDKTDIEKDYEQQDNKEQLKQVWGYVSNICNDRETEILKKIFVDVLTESEISRNYGLSISRIGQIKNRAFRRLRSNEDFVQWSRQFDDICTIAYHYGFNSWKYSNTSSVEKAAELEERKRRRNQRRIERLEQQALLELKQRFAAAGVAFDF